MWPYAELLLTTFLTALAASSTGLFISALFKNADKVTIFVPIALLPQLLFSGLIFKLDGITKLISWIAVCRFSMEAYGTTANLNSLTLKLQEQGFQIVHEVDDFFTFTAGHFAFALGMLCVFIVVFSILAGIVLKNITKDRN